MTCHAVVVVMCRFAAVATGVVGHLGMVDGMFTMTGVIHHFLRLADRSGKAPCDGQ